MKKNYRVVITNGTITDSFTLLGNNKAAVKELCDIVHLGTGWNVKNVSLAMKRK